MPEQRPALLYGIPVTVRSVCIGLFFVICINLVMGYNDHYLGNTFLIGNHFPIASIALLSFLVLGINAAARRFFRVPGLGPGELLLIWGMIGVGCGICSAGLMRYFPPWMVMPAYYATPANEYGHYVLRYIPDWMLVSRDPQEPAVRWFMEGLPAGERIPWGEWLLPMATWFGYVFLFYAVTFALCSLFYRQWASNERLVFPIVHLPVELSQAPEPGKLLNAFLRNPLTWAGIGIPVLLHTVNGLSLFLPGIPQIPLSWPTWGMFPDRPWSEFHMDTARAYFSVIGLTFLLTTEMSFSLWFFFFLYRLSFVYVSWLGAGNTGFWADWSAKVSVFQSAGTLLVLAAFIFWTARGFLARWLARVISGNHDEAADILAPRTAFLLLLAGFAGMLLWFLMAGATWWISLLGIVVFIAVILVLTRIVAESGLLFVQSNVVMLNVLYGLFPSAWLTGPTLTAFMMQRSVIMYDLREILMPYVANGLKACDTVRMRMGKVVGVFALTAAIGLGAAAYGRITTFYKYGGVNMDTYANVNRANDMISSVSNFQKNPPSYDYLQAGEIRLIPVSVAHAGIGAALAVIMLVLRANFLWWPLHPFGYMLCGTWAMGMSWYGIFLGWLAKFAVMTFGGAQAYRRVLPFFLGLVLGESLIAALWVAISLVIGSSGPLILPE